MRKKIMNALLSELRERDDKMNTDIYYDENYCLYIAGYFIREDASIERRSVSPARLTIWLRKILFNDIYISLEK